MTGTGGFKNCRRAAARPLEEIPLTPRLQEMEPEGADVEETATQTRPLRQFKTVLFNDENHTYDYVVEMLTRCCELSREAAFRCAVEVDLTGKTTVYYGTHRDCMDRVHKITHYGPDHRLPHSMDSMAAEVQNF